MLNFLIPFSDGPSPCSYLPDQIARLPMGLPAEAIAPERFDELMEKGYRRSGTFFYYTKCPTCCACQPIRIPVADFRPNRSQRRVWARSDQFRFELSSPKVDQNRVDLFNLHRDQRGLSHSESPIDAREYSSFLLGSPNPSAELTLWKGDHLVAVSITDVGLTCISAVYCFFDPEYSRWSPGTLCILKQVEWACSVGKEWLYLGFYVAANSHLSYKANFRPQQRRINGSWQDVE